MKDIGLFQEVAHRADVELELIPLLITIFNDGIEKFGPPELSPKLSNVWNSAQVCLFSQMAFQRKCKTMSQKSQDMRLKFPQVAILHFSLNLNSKFVLVWSKGPIG